MFSSKNTEHYLVPAFQLCFSFVLCDSKNKYILVLLVEQNKQFEDVTLGSGKFLNNNKITFFTIF